MPNYYVQEIKYQNGNTTIYAEQGPHNHDRSIQFTKDALDWLVTNARWKREEIEIGKFMKVQGAPAGGKEFKWETSRWVKK
jgi:hypothetical protein